MEIPFVVLSLNQYARDTKNAVQLEPNNWDDYSFKTLFKVIYHDPDGNRFEIGSTKIGYKGQETGWTRDRIPARFLQLPDGWFSIGQDVEFYDNVFRLQGEDVRRVILSSLRDVVAHEEVLKDVKDEDVFRTSLMRYVSHSVLNGQYKRALRGDTLLDDFDFAYKDEGDEKHAAVDLSFKVKAESKPPTNIHVVIGRNGVGKTTLLNNMVSAALRQQGPHRRWYFSGVDDFGIAGELPPDYFSSVISVSFSAFDPFTPPPDQPDASLGLRYFYIGMKTARDDVDIADNDPVLKHESDLVNDFVESFRACLSQDAKKRRLRAAIERLCSDDNFAEMGLDRLFETSEDDAILKAQQTMRLMSSGHKIVLLTITRLVSTVEEKTLVLLDEPESHLHPPLLSAFTRALSDLLLSRNGVAIVATHSPVVTQEVPMTCVWILTRSRAEGRSDRPARETFGENVGLLTKDIFGLEVSRSGFHEMLQSSVNNGGSFDEIMNEYSNRLGMEARAILMSMIHSRDNAWQGQQ